AGDRLRFSHDLIREALYRNTPEPIRASLHRLAATALAARSPPPPVVAGHLLAGGVDVHAVGQLRRAAAALAGSDPAGALAMIDRALDAPGVDPSVRQDLTLERVRLLAAVGRLAEAEPEARSLVAGAASPTIQSEAEIALAEVLLLS